MNEENFSRGQTLKNRYKAILIIREIPNKRYNGSIGNSRDCSLSTFPNTAS
uniref:Uncharacterized protein n=1 Tax=Wuchereria bancrofti TaxID=6293 RepID=A0AAF5PGH1_WUCBA